jgi:hypothetical protein
MLSPGRGLHTLDLNLIADGSARIPYGAGRQLQYGIGFRLDGSDTPRLHVFLDVNNRVLMVKIDHVNGIPHRQGVYAVAGDDPKASTETKGTRMGSKQPLESTPMSIGDFDFMSQKCLPGSIECVHLTGVAAHNCPLVFQFAGLQVVNSQRRQDDHCDH